MLPFSMRALCVRFLKARFFQIAFELFDSSGHTGIIYDTERSRAINPCDPLSDRIATRGVLDVASRDRCCRNQMTQIHPDQIRL